MLKNNSGQAMSEYLIITLLIATASILAVTSIGKTVKSKLDLINNNIDRDVTLKAVRGS